MSRRYELILPSAVSAFQAAQPNQTLLSFLLNPNGISAQEIWTQTGQNNAAQTIRQTLPRNSLHFRMEVTPNSPITQQEIDDVGAFFQTLSVGLQDSSHAVHLRALFSAVIFESLFPTSFETIAQLIQVHPNVIAAHEEQLKNVKVPLGAGPGAPVHQQETLDRYLDAQARGDYLGMAEFFFLLDRGGGIPPNGLLNLVFVILAFYRQNTLLTWLEARVQTDFLSVQTCLKALPFSLMCQIATQSRDHLIKLEAIRLASKNNHQPIGFSSNALATLISSLSTSTVGWEYFCRHFGQYPTRTPNLWEPTGIALGNSTKDCIIELHKRFNSSLSSADAYSKIWLGLAAQNNVPVMELFLTQTLIFWKRALRNNRKSPSEHAINFDLTAYVGVAINALLCSGNDQWIERRILRLFDHLLTSREKWFSTSEELRTHGVLFCSYILPYIVAYKAKGQGNQSFDDRIREFVRREIEDFYFSLLVDFGRVTRCVDDLLNGVDPSVALSALNTR